MKTFLKKLNIGKTTSTITVEHDNTDKSVLPLNEITAIAILLGGYNEFGRKIKLQEYQRIKEQFDYCIAEIKGLL